MNSAFEKVQSSEGQELRIYDAPSTTSSALTVEKVAITAVTPVLLRPGEVGFVISTLDTDRVPWVVLANNRLVLTDLSARYPGTNRRQLMNFGISIWKI